MAVRSMATKDGRTEDERRKPKPSPAMVSKNGVIGAMILILRIIALVLIVASTFGNYVQFMGGWPAKGQPFVIDPIIVGVAIAYQVIFSLLQWGFKAGEMWIPYGLALIASAIPSFLTYNAWAGPYLATQLGPLFAAIVLFLSSVGADALPEWVLVE